MEYDLKLYGPPGTGKTTSGINWLSQVIAEGCDPYRAAFVSFTNVACDVARERLAERLETSPEAFEFCRTLHSCAKRALGIGGDDWNQSTPAHLKRFGQEYGYDLLPGKRGGDGDDLEDLQAATGKHGPLLAIWDYGRNRLIRDPEGAFEAWRQLNYVDAQRVDFGEYRQFVADWERDKALGNRKDFTDLLLGVAEADTWLPVSAVAIDEAQDLSPAQWMVAEKLFAGAERSACFADDDQAIFSFQGAEPDLFNSRVARERVLLEKSYRLPRAVCEVALRVIGQNRNRVPKVIRPMDCEGEARRVTSLRDLDFANGESWLILVRNWRFLAEIVSWLEAQGFPYRIPSGRHYCPWDEKGPYRAARSMRSLADGGEISLTDLSVLAGKTRAETAKHAGAWKYGSKGKLSTLAEAEPFGKVGLRELLGLGLTDTGLTRILNTDLSLLEGVSVRDRDAYQSAMREGRFDDEPRIRVTSIHGAKGDEADNVVVLESCSMAPYRNLQDFERCEEEIRLQYVAVTRARKRVYALEMPLGQPWLIGGWR